MADSSVVPNKARRGEEAIRSNEVTPSSVSIAKF